MGSDICIHHSAEVSPEASIGTGTKVWHQAQIREGASLGEQCVIGKDVYIDKGVIIGHRVKIQNSVSVYQGVTLEDDVFVGPHATFTNDKYPRADNPNWVVTPTLVKRGASIGANATIVCGVIIGEGAIVGAGAVVTRDVPAGVIVVGNPARPLTSADTSATKLSHHPLSVLLIGYGAMGFHHARVVTSLPEQFSLTAIADPAVSARESAKLLYPAARVVEDYQSCVADVDVVIIASPIHTHQGITRELLMAGKHCLLEKPCTQDFSSAQELFDLATHQHVVLQVGHVERFNPAVEALFRMLEGEQVVSITAQRWGLATKLSDSDVVFDLMIHDLELVAALLSQNPVAVRAQRFGYGELLDAACVMVTYSGGAQAVFNASRITPKRHRVLQLTTRSRHYELDLAARTLRAYWPSSSADKSGASGTESQLIEFASGADPLTRQALAFAACVQKGTPPLVSEVSVLAAVKLAAEIKQQLGVQR